MNDYRNYKAEDFLSDEFFIEWVLRATPEHQLFWETWLAENPDRSDSVHRASTIIRSLYLQPNSKQLSDEDIVSITDRFLHDTSARRSRVFRLPQRWLTVAAVLIFAMISVLIYFKQYRQSANDTSALASPSLVKIVNSGQTPKLLQLTDGSLVVLKARSEITYPLKFNPAKREVFLKGEAFFEVRKDPVKPFLVHAGHMTTRVLGTSFTVSAYHGDSGFRVVVNTGKVQIYDKRKSANGTSKASVILTPNLQAVYHTELASFKTNTLKVPLILSLQVAKKEFLFTNAPLPVIIAKLEQAYGVTINYNKVKYDDVTVTASLSRLPLDEKVRAICKAIDAVYEFKDGVMSIK